MRNFLKNNRSEVIIAISVFLISIISFNLGQLKAKRDLKTPFKYNESGEVPRSKLPVVASKNSDKYHFEWCLGAKKIKPENKIVFNTEEAAIAAGLTLAANCSR